MATKRITALTELAYADMAAADALAIEDITAGQTKKAELSDLKQYMLENKTIGGSGSGDIVTVGGTQTLTAKTFTSPKINSTTAITSTSEELNILDGVTATYLEINKLSGLTPSTTELNYVDGATSNIQAQINGLSAVVTPTNVTYAFVYEFDADITNTYIDFDNAGIKAFSPLPSGYEVNYLSVVPTLYSRTGGSLTLLPWSATYTFKVNRQGTNPNYYLDYLRIDGLTPEDPYSIALTFTAVVIPGV